MINAPIILHEKKNNKFLINFLKHEKHYYVKSTQYLTPHKIINKFIINMAKAGVCKFPFIPFQ